LFSSRGEAVGAVDVFPHPGVTEVDSTDEVTGAVGVVAVLLTRLKWLIARTTPTTATIATKTAAAETTGIQMRRLFVGGPLVGGWTVIGGGVAALSVGAARVSGCRADTVGGFATNRCAASGR
jgi:hypothetical protein